MQQMCNRRRGEVVANIGGETMRLRLTLGALAELESALGADDLAQLGQRLARGALSARDLRAIVVAGLRGAGMKITDAEADDLPVAGELPSMAAAAVELLALTFGEGDGASHGALSDGRREAVGGPFAPMARRRASRRGRGRFPGMRSWLSAWGGWVWRRMCSGR